MIKNIIVFLMLLSQFSCIEEYRFSGDADFIPNVVVDAILNDNNSQQKIKLSLTSSYKSYQYTPLTDCSVQVQDVYGNAFYFYEDYTNRGEYLGEIPQAWFFKGNGFNLFFVTPEGKQYSSDFEMFEPCPEIDSISYNLLMDPNTVYDNVIKMGLQFYVLLHKYDTKQRYYKWKLDETYEYHSTWPIQRYYKGGVVSVPKHYSLYYCYKTEQVKQIFITETGHIQDGSSIQFPLHYIDNRIQKLAFRYSLLVSQYSISKEAYQYWDKLQLNQEQSGGLFDRQPSVAVGNVECVSNIEERVMGYFGVSSLKTKRIFVQNVPGLEFSSEMFCTAGPIDGEAISESTPEDWPIYFTGLIDDLGRQYTAPQYCFDCTKYGGKTEIPDFWK